MKINSTVALTVLATICLLSCAHFDSQPRNPSSSPELQNLYLQKLEIDILSEKINYLAAVQKWSKPSSSETADLYPTQATARDLESMRGELTLKKDAFESAALRTQLSKENNNTTYGKINQPWRKSEQIFLLYNVHNYKKPKTRYYEVSEAYETKLVFENRYFSWLKKNLQTQQQDTAQIYFLKSKFSCVGPYKWNGKERSAGHVEEFNWQDQSQTAMKPTATLSEKSQDCQFKFENTDHPEGGVVNFKSSKDSVLDQFSNRFETCSHADVSELRGPEKFFYGSTYPRLTCATRVSDFISLPLPTQTIETKLEFLTGEPVPDDFWNDRNYEFSMEKAPHFDAIFVSYLIFRNDFFGNAIADVLDWHAQQGTQVYIMTAKVANNDQDRSLFQELMAGNPNIHIQEYSYKSRSGLGAVDKFDELHRVLHAKMFLTYSKNEPALTRGFFGGRNLGDPYAFDTNASDGKWEFSKKYDTAPFRDYEAIIKDAPFIEKIITQFATLWNRDSVTLMVRDTVLSLQSNKKMFPKDINLSQPEARHILSIPYNDGMNLEDFFVGMINSAEKEIYITTPYFNPTQKISEALVKAADRGVSLTILSLYNLAGDTAGMILGDINKKSANNFVEKLNMYRYKGPSILHSKLMMIDGKMTFFGAVNLNQRSFSHDVENGVLSLSTQFNKDVKAIFDNYMTTADRIDKKMKVDFWKNIFINVFGKDF